MVIRVQWTVSLASDEPFHKCSVFGNYSTFSKHEFDLIVCFVEVMKSLIIDCSSYSVKSTGILQSRNVWTTLSAAASLMQAIYSISIGTWM